MSNRIVSHFLADILAAINAVARFTAQMDFEQFQSDEKTIRAVERELEIIGEAVKKIPEHITVAHPFVPWRAIAGMRDRVPPIISYSEESGPQTALTARRTWTR